jgi:hypothetical protein
MANRSRSLGVSVSASASSSSTDMLSSRLVMVNGMPVPRFKEGESGRAVGSLATPDETPCA